MTLSALGDTAVLMTLGANIDETMAARVRALAAVIERHRPPGVVDVVPAFASVAVFYDLAHFGDLARLRADLESLASRADISVVTAEVRRIDIPVCYGGEFGPDLAVVGARHALSDPEVITLHTSADYLVHAIGFVPGFPYLGGLSEKLATPRRATPRPAVAAGSVGIGDAQTGVYPMATPGGWNLVGRTPLRLFDAGRTEPALLRVGDRVTFRSIPREEFERTEAERNASRYTSDGRCAPPGAADGNAMRDTLPGVEVVKAGMFTTVQDGGRPGHRAQGVALSGAVDPFALRLANLLVGNAENAAGLEFTLVGPELKFLHDTVVAVGGADFAALPRWRPIRIAAGSVLNLGAARAGYRGYLALAGGLDVPPLLGSRSTHVRARLGGLEGRVLRDGDVLPVPAVRRGVAGNWHIDERILPPYSSTPAIRVVRGAQADEFGRVLFSATYQVSRQSDRMGVRLTGPVLARTTSDDLLSAAVAPGTVQVPPDGQPIVLMADAQTIGGYPQIAHVIAPDLPLVAQLRPGDTLTFREVTLAEAHELALAREHALGILREGLAQKIV